MEFIRGRRAIVLLNKTDLKLAVDKDELENACGHAVIPISAKEEQGIEALEEEIKRLFYHGKYPLTSRCTLPMFAIKRHWNRH